MDRQWSAKHLSRFPDIDTFVSKWVNRKNVNSWKRFVPQYKVVCEPHSPTPKVDFVGYFECLNEDFAYIQQKVGSKSNLQHLNKTEGAKRDYRDYYTDVSRKIVEDVYTEDIRLFGYDFDNASLKKR